MNSSNIQVNAPNRYKETPLCSSWTITVNSSVLLC